MDYAAIYIFNASAAPIASRVAEALKSHPWTSPAGDKKSATRIFLPARLAEEVTFHTNIPAFIQPFIRLAPLLEKTFPGSWAHIFIGAVGIAVRAIAPFLLHKSADPPVLVIDPAGKYVISLLSGHWGGANDLARCLAASIDAEPVITTASDSLNRGISLDSIVQSAGLRILDWKGLAQAQGLLLEKKVVYLYDPLSLLPHVTGLVRIAAPEDAGDSTLVLVDYKQYASRKSWIRVGPAVFYLGFGFRKGVQAEELFEACQLFCSQINISSGLVRMCGSVAQKAAEPAAVKFASMLDAPLKGFSPEKLANISTPNPSDACGRLFCLPPFSVSESAALLTAEDAERRATAQCGTPPVLWAKKHIFFGRITMALAVSGQFWDKFQTARPWI